MKSYDNLISSLNEINDIQNFTISSLPHCSNLLYQLTKKEAGKEALYNDICQMYLLIRNIIYNKNNIADYVKKIVDAVNGYMEFFWPPNNNPFLHQADFTSSIVPEMLCIIFSKIINPLNIGLVVTAQKDLTIECIFEITNGGQIKFKNKRVDVSVIKPCALTFNNVKYELSIPLVAIEVKTNLDKNMISGIEHSVTELKKTFPECSYYVISELSDFDVKKSNYASSGIDEIYILRKQKRGVIRRRPELRNPIDYHLVNEITSMLKTNIDAISSNRTSLLARMQKGRLIGG